MVFIITNPIKTTLLRKDLIIDSGSKNFLPHFRVELFVRNWPILISCFHARIGHVMCVGKLHRGLRYVLAKVPSTQNESASK